MKKTIKILLVLALAMLCIGMISCTNVEHAITETPTGAPKTIDVIPVLTSLPISDIKTTPDTEPTPTPTLTPTPTVTPTPSLQLKNVYLTIEAIDENGFAGNARVFSGIDTTVTPYLTGTLYLIYPEASEKFAVSDYIFFTVDPSKLTQTDGECVDMTDGSVVGYKYTVSEVYYPECEPELLRPFLPAAKPIIYLYPEEDTLCSVKLRLDGEFSCTYPLYGDNGWQNFIAKPDGTLIFPNGREYYALYWEGMVNTEADFSYGFCVKGEDSAAFFEDVLEKIGLSEREANEFIVYWLPIFERNEYNLVTFNTEKYSAAAELEITPTPDSILRVYMQYKAVDEFVNIEPQEFGGFERRGFTVVEWGGGNCG